MCIFAFHLAMNLLCTTFLFGVVTCSWQCFRFARCLSVVVYIFQFLFFCASCSIFNVQNGIRSCAHRSCICSINIINENTVLCSKSTSSQVRNTTKKKNYMKSAYEYVIQLISIISLFGLIFICVSMGLLYSYPCRFCNITITPDTFDILMLRS